MITNETKYLVFRRGIVYEGSRHQLWALYPTPLISPAVCACVEGQNLVFREDFFDPMTRIRRGRFYRRHGDRGANRWFGSRVSNGLYGPLVGISCDQFDEDDSCELVHIPDDKVIRKEIVQIGARNAVTAWRIVGVEQNIFGQQVLTLRAQSLFGVLPELSNVLLDGENDPVEQDKIIQVGVSLGRLTDIYHRFQPVPTVDVARETTKVILTAWIGQSAEGKDLAKVIKEIPNGKDLARWSASIVNRLHPRGKAAERELQASQGVALRTVTDDDAESSVHLVGMLLREIGWAQS